MKQAFKQKKTIIWFYKTGIKITVLSSIIKITVMSSIIKSYCVVKYYQILLCCPVFFPQMVGIVDPEDVA